MALLLPAPSVRSATGRTSSAPRRPGLAVVGPALALVVALGATGWLARAAIADDGGPALDTAAAPVDVRLDGSLDTAGLAGGGTTESTLTVTNVGGRAMRWAIVPQVSGTPEVAGAVRATVVPGACGAAAAPELGAGSLAPQPLSGGESTPVCVRLQLPRSAAAIPGSLDVRVQVRATAA